MITIHPIYQRFFPAESDALPEAPWTEFRSNEAELQDLPSAADFAIDHRTWGQTCKKVALLVLKIVLFPWILFEAVTWLVQRAVMAGLYPAQSYFLKKCAFPQWKGEALDKLRVGLPEQFPKEVIRHVRLDKNGTSYSGLLLGTPETLGNGKWVLNALGNGQPIETSVRQSLSYHQIGYNVLMVNGRGVGQSRGLAKGSNVGEAQVVGLNFLEQVIKANKIVLVGFSLGGAAIGAAIKEHTFSPAQRDYLAVRIMSFGSVSHVAHEILKKHNSCFTPIAKGVIAWTDCEIDSVAASQQLTDLHIPEVIIQAGSSQTEFQDDGVIPAAATLGQRLQQAELSEVHLKTFINIPNAKHHVLPIAEILQSIQDWEKESLSEVTAASEFASVDETGYLP